MEGGPRDCGLSHIAQDMAKSRFWPTLSPKLGFGVGKMAQSSLWYAQCGVSHGPKYPIMGFGTILSQFGPFLAYFRPMLAPRGKQDQFELVHPYPKSFRAEITDGVPRFNTQVSMHGNRVSSKSSKVTTDGRSWGVPNSVSLMVLCRGNYPPSFGVVRTVTLGLLAAGLLERNGSPPLDLPS